MKRIFEEEARLQRLLDVEAALARAESKVGLVPREAASEITKKATTKLVTVKRQNGRRSNAVRIRLPPSDARRRR